MNKHLFFVWPKANKGAEMLDDPHSAAPAAELAGMVLTSAIAAQAGRPGFDPRWGAELQVPSR